MLSPGWIKESTGKGSAERRAGAPPEDAAGGGGDLSVKSAFRKAMRGAIRSLDGAEEGGAPEQTAHKEQTANAQGQARNQRRQEQGKTDKEREMDEQEKALFAQAIPSDMGECEALAKTIFNNSFDIVVQTFETAQAKAMLVFVDGLVDKDLIDRDIIQHLKSPAFDGNVDLAVKTVFTKTEDLASFVQNVLGGMVAVFYEKSQSIWVVEFRHWAQRAVAEPTAEAVIRGPKEGFTENIRTNTSMLRRKIKTHNLVVENMVLGRQTNTLVELVYVRGIVNQMVLAEAKKRLAKIDVDRILESGHIEQYICENTFAPVSGIGITQKPDLLASRLLEGRVGILCDGTPHVLTIPEMFTETLQNGEDYYNRTVYASFMRLLRFIGLAISVVLPGVAIALLIYHQEAIPSEFLASVIESMQRTPMSFSVEILIMMVMFELLKEAGTRLPQVVGSAITIVGSLIIGEAAVNAGLVSETAVIIVALTAVAAFIVPNLAEYSLVYRLLFWLLGSTMGLIGIGASVMILLTQLISTDTFGIPILSNFSREEMKDTFVRFPLKALKYRPRTIVNDNVKRNDM